MKDCTVIVIGCDEYVDVLEINAIFKKKYWNNCSMPYMLVTQTIIPQNNVYDKVIMTSQETPWMSRLEKALEQVETPYVCIMCDDYFYSQNVDEGFFESSIEQMKKNNVGLLKIIPTNFIRGFKKISHQYKEYTLNNSFRISYYPSIWNVEYLKKFSGTEYSVWEAERINSISSKKYTEKIWTVYRNELNIVHAIMGGRWTKEVVRFFKKENIPVALYSARKIKNTKMYIKDGVYNVVMTLAPKFTLKLQKMFNVGRH